MKKLDDKLVHELALRISLLGILLPAPMWDPISEGNVLVVFDETPNRRQCDVMRPETTTKSLAIEIERLQKKRKRK